MDVTIVSWSDPLCMLASTADWANRTLEKVRSITWPAHAATDNIRLPYLVHRQPQRQEAWLHAQDIRCPAQHPSKSSEKHMRRLQSDIEGRA
jgi:hypothetical protein